MNKPEEKIHTIFAVHGYNEHVSGLAARTKKLKSDIDELAKRSGIEAETTLGQWETSITLTCKDHPPASFLAAIEKLDGYALRDNGPNGSRQSAAWREEHKKKGRGGKIAGILALAFSSAFAPDARAAPSSEPQEIRIDAKSCSVQEIFDSGELTITMHFGRQAVDVRSTDGDESIPFSKLDLAGKNHVRMRAAQLPDTCLKGTEFEAKPLKPNA